MSQNVPFHLGMAPVQHQQHHAPSSQPANGVPAQPAQMAAAPSGAFDMSALQGISPQQLALIAQLLQSGQIPFPPPPPPGTVGGTSPPTVQPQPLQPAKSSSQAEEDTDMDKEEGELEEGEDGDATSSRDFLRTPPKGPRRRSKSPRHRVPSIQGVKRGSQPSPLLQQPQPASAPRRPSGLNTVTSVSQLKGEHMPNQELSKDASIKAFIVEMHKAGFTFDQVAKEISNVSALRHLYQQLGVPLTSANDVTGMETTHSAPQTAQNQRKVSTKRLAPAKAPAAQDRSAYLAKLQAAKNKKSEPTAATPPKAVESAEEPVKPETSTRSAPPAKPTNPVIASKVHDMTPIIKQRLEAWRAEQAAKKNAVKLSSDNDSTSSPAAASTPHKQSIGEPKTGLGARMADAAARATGEVVVVPSRPDSKSHLQTASKTDWPLTTNQTIAPPRLDSAASASPTLNRGFGLPGLFTTLPAMVASAQQRPSSAVSTPSYAAHSNTLQQPSLPMPLPHMYEQNTPQSSTHGVTPPSRPIRTQSYGAGSYRQSYWPSEPEEQFVIHDTEDEDEESGDEMEIDDSEQEQPNVANEKLAQSITQQPSVPFTPAPSGTPTNAPKRKNYQDMSLDELKSHIAKAAKRQKTGNGDVISNQADQEKSALSAPLSASASGNATPSAGSVPSDGHSTSATAVSKKETMDALQQRMEAAQRALAASRQNANTLARSPIGVQRAGGVDVAPEPLSTPASQMLREPATESIEAEAPVQELSSDDDEAMYAEPTVNSATTPQDITGSKSEIARIQGVGNEAGATSVPPQPLIAESNDPAQDAASTWSDDDEAMYQTKSSIPTNKLREQDASVEQRVDEAAEHISENEDDLDDVYEPADPAILPESATAIAPVEVSSDEEDNDEEDTDRDTDERDHADDDEGEDSEDAMDTSDDLEPDAARHFQQELDQASTSSQHSSSEDSADEDVTNENVANKAHTIDDELAPELQPSREELTVPSEEPRNLHFFQAYESPLTKFKDFRYHPDYLNTVSGGYKSLTYCHKIHPETPLCRYEAGGGACYDKTCEYQHFRTMGLTDNDLLRSMGTEKVPVHTPEEDKRWKSGLNGVVQELRNTNQGKDVLAIARRIAEYRREFRGDPTKTLLLD